MQRGESRAGRWCARERGARGRSRFVAAVVARVPVARGGPEWTQRTDERGEGFFGSEARAHNEVRAREEGRVRPLVRVVEGPQHEALAVPRALAQQRVRPLAVPVELRRPTPGIEAREGPVRTTGVRVRARMGARARQNEPCRG